MPIVSPMKHANCQHLSLIDAENVSVAKAEEIIWNVNRFVGSTRIYGCPRSLKPWQTVIEDYALQTRMHGGGKQAADALMRADAWRCFEQKHITHFVFVTNDGGFAQDCRDLRDQGCHITVIGETRASHQLKGACTHFILLDWNL